MNTTKLKKEELLLYGVISKGGLSREEYLEKIKQSIDAGVTILQLREKNMDTENFIELGKKVKKITDEMGIKLIINDNIEVCKEIDCEGVHIGQGDISPIEARKILGKNKIIGLSIQTREHLEKSIGSDVDYYGIGAVFSTKTKLDAADVSYSDLKALSLDSKIPVVAIGGINKSNILGLEGTGIAGVAIVSAIYGVEDTYRESKVLSDLAKKIIFLGGGKNMNTVLTIAGSDSSGGAGIQADLKTFTMHNTFGMSVITAITAQNTTGVRSIQNINKEIIEDQIDAVFEDIYPMAVKIGMVSNKEIIKVISEKLKKYNAKNIVLDTVMVSTSGHELLEKDARETLVKELLPLASIITPNLPEAEILCGFKINNEEEMKKACQKISSYYQGYILIKGGHLKNSEKATDILYKDGKYKMFENNFIDNKNTHGTGCTLSSAIAANLSLGKNIEESVKLAKEYVYSAISSNINLGKGKGPIDHMYKLKYTK